MDKAKVLFLCTGNSARSQMAEAFLRKYGEDRYEALSAGLEPKGIHPLTVKAMAEIGIRLDNQKSKSLKQYLGKENIAHLITVCGHAEENCPYAFLRTAGEHIHWHFEDPAAAEGTEAQQLEKFREVRDQIKKHVKNWLAS
ncbi:MAG: arsenate reductase ArsC [Thermodesulfobacteriota bacterium]